jgi:hypothetical protein
MEITEGLEMEITEGLEMEITKDPMEGATEGDLAGIRKIPTRASRLARSFIPLIVVLEINPYSRR